MNTLTQEALFDTSIDASTVWQQKMLDIKAGQFTFVDLFAGIGGFRIPLEEMGGVCVGFSEIDKTAIEVYKQNFDTSHELQLGDITKLQGAPKVDLVTGGVPCQSWSVAGKMKGFEDPRGALWFDTIQFIDRAKPKAFIFENVKGLADPRNKQNLDLIVGSFKNLGYGVSYRVLNAFDFDLPQNRERIFIIGVQKAIGKTFEFPKKSTFLPRLSSVLEGATAYTHTKIKNRSNIKNSFNISYQVNHNNFFTFCDTRNGKHSIHSWDLIDCTHSQKQICMALLQNRRKKLYGQKDGNPLSFEVLNQTVGGIQQEDLDSLLKKKIILKKDGKYDFVNSKNSSGISGIYRVFLPSSHVFSTLTKTGIRDLVATVDIPSQVIDTKQYFLDNVYKKNLMRKLSTREASRLQGFPDWFKFSQTDSKNFGLLGNALGVNIIRSIASNLIPMITK
jgi:DNA (cytosine-5)-methyltransferase 1